MRSNRVAPSRRPRPALSPPNSTSRHAAAVGQQIEVRRALPAQAVDHGAFEALEADRLELENLRDVVGRRKGVGIAEADQRAVLRAVDQRHLGLEHDGAGAFACPTSARATLKPVLGQQLVEVVARDPPRDRGKPRRGCSRRILVANAICSRA